MTHVRHQIMPSIRSIRAIEPITNELGNIFALPSNYIP